MDPVGRASEGHCVPGWAEVGHVELAHTWVLQKPPDSFPGAEVHGWSGLPASGTT